VRSLHVIGSRQFGGADQFYVRLVRALNDSGHQAIPVCRPGSPVARALATAGVARRHLPLASKWDLYSAWRIRRLVGELRPEVVQTYMGRATRLTRLSSAGPAVHLARLGGYYKVRGYYEHAHAWVGNTRGLCDYLVAEGLPREKVHLIGNFVDEPDPVSEEEVRGLRERYALPSDALVLYSLARFIDIKGIDDLLRAFALLPARLASRPLALVVSGDGPLRADLHRLAADLGLSDRVRWTGWQDRPGPFYRTADLFVCPSRHETLGNVILEAWSYGKAVVSTDTPGALELVDDGRTGLLAARGNPATLAARIEEALRGPRERLLALADAGKARVLSEHSRHAIVSAYTELYARLSADRRSTTAGAAVLPGA